MLQGCLGAVLATTASISGEDKTAWCSPGKGSKLRAHGLVPVERLWFCIIAKVGLKLVESPNFGVISIR